MKNKDRMNILWGILISIIIFGVITFSFLMVYDIPGGIFLKMGIEATHTCVVKGR